MTNGKISAKEILAKTGPGIIMAAAAVGTGTITTSAILGARYEYGMIWMVILALLMRGIYMRSAYTAQVVLGMPILDCIQAYYGKALCAVAGFVCAFGCVAYEVGNFSGTGISLNLLFGLRPLLVPQCFIALDMGFLLRRSGSGPPLHPLQFHPQDRLALSLGSLFHVKPLGLSL